ncbi:uncharacterized protein LOC141677832 isoform X1 [Apium graveolens]|uniref:uncharacterized protein LOC141677832 isoform X1 n=1 Tax=Apium graveolens TaxID=4045 RepID=UPI003D7BE54A
MDVDEQRMPLYGRVKRELLEPEHKDVGELNKHEKLVEAIRQVDIIIVMLGMPPIMDQLKIITTMKEASNVKRFIPSEFGERPPTRAESPKHGKNKSVTGGLVNSLEVSGSGPSHQEYDRSPKLSQANNCKDVSVSKKLLRKSFSRR